MNKYHFFKKGHICLAVLLQQARAWHRERVGLPQGGGCHGNQSGSHRTSSGTSPQRQGLSTTPIIKALLRAHGSLFFFLLKSSLLPYLLRIGRRNPAISALLAADPAMSEHSPPSFLPHCLLLSISSLWWPLRGQNVIVHQ